MNQRARICGKCGYDLSGVNRLTGTCPECGNFYDAMSGRGLQREEASSHRQKMDRLVARLRTISIGAFTLCVLACGGLASQISQNPYRPLAIAGVIGGVGVLATVTSFLYEKEDD